MDSKSNGIKPAWVDGKAVDSKVVESGSTKRKNGFGYGLMVGMIGGIPITIVITISCGFCIWSVVAFLGMLCVGVLVGGSLGRYLNCKNIVDRLEKVIHKSYDDDVVESARVNGIKILAVKLHCMLDGVNDSILINRENYNVIITKLNNTYNEIRNIEDVMRKSILDNMRESFEYWENEKRYIDIK